MDPIAAALIFVPCALIGLHASILMQKRYNAAKAGIALKNRPVLWALVITCWVITVTASWLGFLSLRALFGFPRFEWAPATNVVIAGVVLLLPALINWKVTQVVKAREDAALDEDDES